MTLAFNAMMFARDVHRHQRRKYTNNPYVDHLAEVAGIVATLNFRPLHHHTPIAVAWLHGCVQNCGVTTDQLRSSFGVSVAQGVQLLSDF